MFKIERERCEHGGCIAKVIYPLFADYREEMILKKRRKRILISVIVCLIIFLLGGICIVSLKKDHENDKNKEKVSNEKSDETVKEELEDKETHWC